jgi:ubiquinone/menaquinone biosynthesis C-methylase UbiE
MVAARSIFDIAGQQAECITGDLMQMNFAADSFDLVFNAGVLEHFEPDERAAALREMTRVTKPGGTVLVAVPNHFSKPYKYGYDFRHQLGKWQYPDEFAIYDFSAEASDITDLENPERIVISPNTAYAFLRKYQRLWFRLTNLFQRHEGYLTVLIYRKTG